MLGTSGPKLRIRGLIRVRGCRVEGFRKCDLGNTAVYDFFGDP